MIKTIIKKIILTTYDLLFWRLKNFFIHPLCPLCDSKTNQENAYKRHFRKCNNCNFIFSNDVPSIILDIGMGMTGSWGGIKSGGEREYWLTKFLYSNFERKKTLLYGVGTAFGFVKLLDEKYDVYGSDISKNVVTYYDNLLPNKYFHAYKIDGLFGYIIATEVFEHFVRPRKDFELILNHLENDGILCGTTNFYPDSGPIIDNQQLGYMEIKEHQSYWSKKSMSMFAKKHKLELILFKMIRPGSVLRDTKYNEIYENKVVFFLTRDKKKYKKLLKIRDKNRILNLDVEKIKF